MQSTAGRLLQQRLSRLRAPPSPAGRPVGRLCSARTCARRLITAMSSSSSSSAAAAPAEPPTAACVSWSLVMTNSSLPSLAGCMPLVRQLLLAAAARLHARSSSSSRLASSALQADVGVWRVATGWYRRGGAARVTTRQHRPRLRAPPQLPLPQLCIRPRSPPVGSAGKRAPPSSCGCSDSSLYAAPLTV
jgi:hypothetical protein